MFDSPTNGDSSEASGAGGELNGNYAVFNYLEDSSAGGGAALSNGNLQIDGTSSEQFRAATIPVSSGKWYFEMVQVYGTDFGPGVWAYPLTSPSSNFYENTNYRYNSNGGVYNQSSKLTDYSTFTRGDIIGTALDMDNGKVYFSKNGVWQNSGNPATQTNPAATGLTGTWVFGASTNGNDTILQANFGALPFTYNAPSGFEALNTASMSAASISNPSEYFDILTYTGITQSPRTLTGLSIAEPDWVWVKNRDDSSPHLIWDAVRGTDKNMRTDTTNNETEVSGSSNGIISTSAANGFVVKNGSGSGTNAGSSGSDDIVAWCWEAGSSTVTNNVGDITTTLRANPTAGFSIATYSGSGTSGDTLGHGLNADPEFVIIKARDKTDDWRVYHKGVGTGHYLRLNGDHAKTTTNNWQSISTTTFGIDNDSAVNSSSYTYVAYFFAPVAGYSSFGSFTGNASADGPFVYTGFKPKFLLLKNADSAYNWRINDAERSPFNVVDETLFPNESNAEATSSSNLVDFLSNGFKLKASGSGSNASGDTIVYAAFSEHPFQANGGIAR